MSHRPLPPKSHRAARKPARGGSRRAQVRPRHGRIAALTGAVAITASALSVGAVSGLATGSLKPVGSSVAKMNVAEQRLTLVTATDNALAMASRVGRQSTALDVSNAASKVDTGPTATAKPDAAADGASADGASADDTADPATQAPAGSGQGRRAVFDMSEQRVWIVGSDDSVERSYLVSGSLTNNLRPGQYAVFSRSRYAWGIDDSGEMQYFVRFTRGQNAAIGFHSIPTKDGQALQSEDQLGTPQSHGCIRQATPDAIAMWEFAQLGTQVNVIA